MKRLFTLFLVLTLLAAIPFGTAATDVRQSERDTFDHDETGLTIPYRLIVPEIYDPDYKFPLVVFFHGAGERGVENENQLNNCVQQIADNMPKALILVPQCSHANQWVDTPWGEGCYNMDDVPESDEMMAVMALVEQITQEYSIDKETIYAAGISMGGFAVWDAMVRYNHIFAAGVAVCGAGDPSKAEILKDTPMFVFHGNQDDTVPVSGSVDMVEAIQAAGGTKVQYQEIAGGGHGIWGQVFNQEALYKELKKCKLSDHYVPEVVEDGSDQPDNPIMKNLPWMIGGGIAVLAVVLVVILLVGKKG